MIFQRLRLFFSGPQPFTWLETRKASVRAKSKSVDEGCLLLRLSPLVIDVSPVLLPRHCQTGSIVCVCSSNCRLFWSNKSIFHTASTLTQSLIWWRIFLSLLQNGRYIKYEYTCKPSPSANNCVASRRPLKSQIIPCKSVPPSKRAKSDVYKLYVPRVAIFAA